MAEKRITTKYLYLRTIRRLALNGGNVRNADLARELGYTRPSITGAVRRFRNEGLIEEEGSGGIRLTDRGMAAAEQSEDRSSVLAGFFRSLGVSEESASDNAGRIEHLISDDLFEAILDKTV